MGKQGEACAGAGNRRVPSGTTPLYLVRPGCGVSVLPREKRALETGRLQTGQPIVEAQRGAERQDAVDAAREHQFDEIGRLEDRSLGHNHHVGV